MPYFVMATSGLGPESNILPSILQCLFLLSPVSCTVACLSELEFSTKFGHLDVSAQWGCPPVSFTESEYMHLVTCIAL